MYIVSPYRWLLASEDVYDDAKRELIARCGPVQLQREEHGAVDALLPFKKSEELEGMKSLRQLGGDASAL